VHLVAFSPDGMRIVSSSEEMKVCVWDAISGVVVSEMQGHEKMVSAMTFSPSGHQIVSGSWDKTVRLWDVASGCQAYPTFRGHEHWVSSVAFSVDGNHIISKSFCDTISWDAASGCQLDSIEESDHSLLHSICITDNGWVVDVVTNQTLCKLPTMFSITCQATNKQSLVVGTEAGRLFMMHFPSTLLTSPGTSTTEGKIL